MPTSELGAHREIITDYFEQVEDPDAVGGYTRLRQVVNPHGEIELVPSVEDAAAAARAEWEALDTKIKALSSVISWRQMDALLSGANALQVAVRTEAVARLIAAARGMHDFDVGVYVAPRSEQEKGETEEGTDNAD